MIKIYINDEEVVSNKEITINEEILATSSTILDNVYPKSWEDTKDYTNKFYYPKDYSKCRIYNDDKLIFFGVVKNTGDISLNPRYPHFCSVQILDFKTFLSEGETFDFVIANKTIKEAIELIVNKISPYGFTLGNIDIYGADEIIGSYSTKDKTAYDVFQYIADITSSKWFTRVVDETEVAIDFYDPDLMPRVDDIEYTSEWFGTHSIKDMTFNYGSYDYRNKQIMISSEVFSSIETAESVYADGYSTTYSLENKIGELKSITIDGKEKTFTTQDNKSLGITADFYYATGEAKLEQNSNDTYTQGTKIIVKYIALVNGRQVVSNADEINRINSQLGIKGEITRYENRNDVTSSEELIKVGESYLRYKGKVEVNLTIETDNKDIFNIGDVAYFNAPLDELKDEYMVKSKETKIVNVNDFYYVFYTYKLVSNFNSERDINWFDNQRNKISGNIAEGEYITRYIDVESTYNIIFNNLSITEIETPYNNILNSVLNSPFNN